MSLESSAEKIVAPISGMLVRLEDVPDPVFSQKMVGDGVSIDPTSNKLLSPVIGKVVQIHSSNHALTIQTTNGFEILIHIGIDTVGLKGKGFSPKVRPGQYVKVGDPLIEFDMDYVASNAKSMMTQVLVTNHGQSTTLVTRQGRVEAGRDIAFDIISKTDTAVEKKIAPQAEALNHAVSEPITILNQMGLHARPAAMLANMAKRFESKISITKGDQQANIKSVLGILTMEVAYRDCVKISATGSDCHEAVDHITRLLRSAPGEDHEIPQQARGPEPREHDYTKNVKILAGVSASPGLAVGNVFQVQHKEVHVVEHGHGVQKEREALYRAINNAKLQIEALQSKLYAEADAGKAAIFAAHCELLDDPDLLALVDQGIISAKSAAFAWQAAFMALVKRMTGLKNELLAARANDLRDVGRRVLDLLAGVTPEKHEVPGNAILIAEDLTPSDTANLDRAKVLGFCTLAGGASSHVAILARSLDIPAIAGIDPRALEITNGTPVILDGTHGVLRLNPSTEDIASIHAQQVTLADKKKQDLKKALEPAITLDGHAIKIVANIGGVSDAKETVAQGGQGVGLLRSEFLFLERTTPPSEEEQFQVYSNIVKALGPERPLIIRTLDIGGDKPLPYMPMAKEENPFLGERGIRVSLNRPELFRQQIRAIVRTSKLGKVSMMFPMIATLEELRLAKTILEEERSSLHISPIPVGIMVEVPSAAIMAEHFAREVDFFSIGSNDLTQYTLAMDRGHAKLAKSVDGLNPSILALISMTVQGASKHGIWVGVCGGIGSDPQAVPLLVGLGVEELSVSVPMIASIKAQIRSLNKSKCQMLAQQALEKCTSAAEVRALVSQQTLH
ncbi:MAG: phosphoenolpyruvate--protein phosphotransferase [Bdellovibrionota bacterium]